MIARAFPYDRPCRFQKFEATETILATATTIWKPGFSGIGKTHEIALLLGKNFVAFINNNDRIYYD